MAAIPSNLQVTGDLQFQFDKRLTGLNRFLIIHKKAGDRACSIRLNFVKRLHYFDKANDIANLHGVAFGFVAWLIR